MWSQEDSVLGLKLKLDYMKRVKWTSFCAREQEKDPTLASLSRDKAVMAIKKKSCIKYYSALVGPGHVTKEFWVFSNNKSLLFLCYF